MPSVKDILIEKLLRYGENLEKKKKNIRNN